MKYRHGTCQSCQAQYKVPASFQADRAKCKSCGGVVAIAPLDGAAPAAAKPVPAKPVTARPVAKPAAAKPAAPKAAEPETDSVRAAAAGAAERVRNAGRKGAASRSSSADKSSEGSRSKSASSSTRSSRRSSAPKKKSPAPMLAAIAIVIVAGGGGAWYMLRDDASSQAAEKVAQAPVEVDNTAAQSSEVDPGQQAADEAAAEAAAAAAAEAEREAAAKAEQEAKAESASEDVDLSVYPDEAKLPGTSDEDWVEIQAWVAEFLDPNAGAAGNRAKLKLAERGRESFPAILNAFKRLDFTSEDGFRGGDLTQRLLMQICGGQNFDWSYGTEPKNVTFNKKVVSLWIKSWMQAREAPKAWAKLTKTSEEDAIALFAITGPFDVAGESPEEAASDALDDF